MNKIKSWILGALAAIGIFQYSRPPVMIDQTITPQTSHVSVPSDGKPEVILIEDGIKGATDAEKKVVVQSVQETNQIDRSDCFKNKILGAKFTETNGLTNQQVYDVLATHPVSIKVEIFNGSFMQNYVYKTMGYDIGDGTVYVNRFFVKTAKQMRSLINHEAEGHQQGFHHNGVKSTSVPYQFNDFTDECGAELESLGMI